MQFTVREWMVNLVVYITPGATVAEALSLMRRRYINSLIVKIKPKEHVYGIITSTDISDKIVAQERNPAETRVEEIMTSPLITVKTTMDLKTCAGLMKAHHIHHLPVEDENGALVGMISATDFMVAAEAMANAPGEVIV